MPKVSVVTGFYNRAAVLERTVESILAQTFADFELIVFDDASRDDTAERLEELSGRYEDPRFTYVVHETNRGFVQGLRDAIAASTGEYVAIQGSGDASLPDRLKLQVALLDERPEVGVVGGWYYNVQERLGTRRLRTPRADGMGFSDFLRENVFSHGEVMIRRSVLDEVGGYRPEFTFAQDYDLWLRIAKVAKFATVPQPVYLRHVQFDGVSYDPRKIVRQSAFTVAARRLAQMTSADEARALEVLRNEGPLAVIPADDREVQQMVVKSSLRMVFFGSPEGGVELAKSSVSSPLRKRLLVAFGKIYPMRWFTPVRWVMQKLLGINPSAS